MKSINRRFIITMLLWQPTYFSITTKTVS